MKSPAIILGILCATALPAQTVKTIIKNGGLNNRYDIVIIGDGYQASEQTKFDNGLSTNFQVSEIQDALATALFRAFFCPTSSTSFRPRVTPV